VGISGRFAKIKDQVYLAKGDLSLEDILLQRKALATAYSYGVFPQPKLHLWLHLFGSGQPQIWQLMVLKTCQQQFLDSESGKRLMFR